MQVTELIEHPELLGRDTLTELRRIVAQCPYYQAARLLLIENLFLLHDPDFDEELRTAALFVPDRSVLFNLVESLKYESGNHEPVEIPEELAPVQQQAAPTNSRTLDIIGQFLQLRPVETAESTRLKGHRPVLDPIGDYTTILEGMDDLIDDSLSASPAAATKPAAPISAHKSALALKGPAAKEAEAEGEASAAGVAPAAPTAYTAAAEGSAAAPIKEEYFTETLAKVFIKQGNFERALEILTKINAESPRANAYFADQIAFLQKLIKLNRLNEKAQ